MLDLRTVVNNLEEVKAGLARRGAEAQLEPIIALDEERRRLIVEVEELRRLQNEANQRIKERIAKEGPQSESVREMRSGLKESSSKIKALEPDLKAVETQIHDALMAVPNLCHESVPDGKDESDNQVLRTVGEPPVFDFEPKWHDELGQSLDILDFARGAKLSGARFTVLKGAGARLERALGQFMLDMQVREHGYTEIMTPLLVLPEILQGTGQLPKFEEDLFKMEGMDRELYLIPTAEVPLTNLYAGEILKAERLPVRLCAHTSCFRSEAGSYGKDVRGYIRQHQFNKVELIHVCRPEKSYEELELLTSHAEAVLKRLELPYRVVSLCSGDMGFSSAKTYDLEVWLPGQGRYREISSCSNCEDFQARRMKLRFKEEGGKPRLCHTLNGSGLAVGRTLVAVLENGQRADGSVRIPEALRPYMDGMSEIRPE